MTLEKGRAALAKMLLSEPLNHLNLSYQQPTPSGKCHKPILIPSLSSSLCIFPHAGPDIKYLLGFVRTQFSTTTTIALVFGPKIKRVLQGEGDKWDLRSRARGISASFSINGGGLMPDEAVDLYQENEELKVTSGNNSTGKN